MRKNLLFSAAILLALSSQAFAGGPSGGVNGDRGQPAGANAAAPVQAGTNAVEVPPDFSAKGPKQAGESGEAKTDTGAAGAAGTAAAQTSVVGNGCVGFFGSRTIPLVSRGLVLYRVTPTTFFDVVMKVTYVGLRSWTVDRHFAPGADSILIRGPSIPWRVKVTIRGFNGQAGCFNFFAG